MYLSPKAIEHIAIGNKPESRINSYKILFAFQLVTYYNITFLYICMIEDMRVTFLRNNV